ncbi:hypothetical protein MLD38_022704 [Melastoma candidum]|uniref:Uncharacterized protein n=1 Tax=Melastoma candidum TaxID=119954 RepID=A0ACB9QKB3_9MYRT|nr:hypothetical protein MLD38_022704 [Melastoma candidum]
MLAMDTTKKLSFTKFIANGDLVIVHERHDATKAVNVTDGSVLQNRFGVLKHSEWIKDISFVIMCLELVPGCLVLESGTGSGSLTTSLARAVAPTGHVHTFDFHEQRAASAREDFERTGVNSVVTVGVRDLQGLGFPDEFVGQADAVFLDLRQPWFAIPSAASTLKPDATLCSFSPCIEQVQRSCETLTEKLTDIRTFEVLLRTHEVREVKTNTVPGHGNISPMRLPRKRRQTTDGDIEQDEPSAVILTKPSGDNLNLN